MQLVAESNVDDARRRSPAPGSPDRRPILSGGEPARPRTRVALSGELDMASAHQVESAITPILQGRPPTHLDLDLAAVPFLDSAGILALLRARERAAEVGCRLVIHNPVRTVRRVLQIAGVDDLLLGSVAADHPPD
ncbi:STAS domain-containing protein [Plantactinospora sp. GCM10030261]|uniref:STAS domain-containing protein n=1 Tax=Plantactinospora sp. GCM10030261 TaxID=3273420 RepID=UPI003616B322